MHFKRCSHSNAPEQNGSSFIAASLVGRWMFAVPSSATAFIHPAAADPARVRKAPAGDLTSSLDETLCFEAESPVAPRLEV